MDTGFGGLSNLTVFPSKPSAVECFFRWMSCTKNDDED
jgi:hypothetical protein